MQPFTILFQKVDLNPENVVIWAQEKWYQWTGIITIPACFLLGMVLMLIYYRYYHPEGKMPAKKQYATLHRDQNRLPYKSISFLFR